MGFLPKGKYLREQLFHLARGHNVLQTALCFLDQASFKGTETNLHRRAVVQDLCSNVGVTNGLLQMRHEKQVARTVIVAMQRNVVDVAEHCSRTQSVRPVAVNVRAKPLNQRGGVEGIALWRIALGKEAFHHTDHLLRLFFFYGKLYFSIDRKERKEP